MSFIVWNNFRCVEMKLIGFDKSTYAGCPNQAKVSEPHSPMFIN